MSDTEFAAPQADGADLDVKNTSRIPAIHIPALLGIGFQHNDPQILTLTLFRFGGRPEEISHRRNRNWR